MFRGGDKDSSFEMNKKMVSDWYGQGEYPGYGSDFEDGSDSESENEITVHSFVTEHRVCQNNADAGERVEFAVLFSEELSVEFQQYIENDMKKEIQEAYERENPNYEASVDIRWGEFDEVREYINNDARNDVAEAFAEMPENIPKDVREVKEELLEMPQVIRDNPTEEVVEESRGNTGHATEVPKDVREVKEVLLEMPQVIRDNPTEEVVEESRGNTGHATEEVVEESRGNTGHATEVVVEEIREIPQDASKHAKEEYEMSSCCACPFLSWFRSIGRRICRAFRRKSPVTLISIRKLEEGEE